MPCERIMGIEVLDEARYQLYRDKMTPMLEAAGGYFGYDFKIAEVLKSKVEQNINRVFTITFPSEDSMNAFFNSPAYLDVKQRYFDDAVGDKTVISLNET